VRRQVEALFTQKDKDRPSAFTPAKSGQRSMRAHFEHKETEQINFVLGSHCDSRNSADRYKTAILNVILGGNMSSRLFEQVREKRGLAYSVRSSVSAYEDAGVLTISAGVDNRKLLQALRVILRELRRLTEQAVSEIELRRAKDYFTGQLMLGLEDGFEHMTWMGERFLYCGETPSVREICENIKAVTAADIRAKARKLFRDQHFSFALIGPVKDKMRSKIEAELKK